MRRPPGVIRFTTWDSCTSGSASAKKPKNFSVDIWISNLMGRDPNSSGAFFPAKGHKIAALTLAAGLNQAASQPQ